MKTTSDSTILSARIRQGADIRVLDEIATEFQLKIEDHLMKVNWWLEEFPGLVEGILSSLWIDLWENTDSFDTSNDLALGKSLLNRALDHADEVNDVLQASSPQAERHLAYERAKVVFLLSISKFSLNQRRVLLADAVFWPKDAHTDELAARLGMTVAAVKQCRQEGWQRLWCELRERAVDFPEDEVR